MADNKEKGINLVVGGHKVDHVGTKLGQAVDKVADGKIKVDAEKLGKKLDSKNVEINVDKLKKKIDKK